MKFSAELLEANKQEEFEGALPTTIYQAGFSEIYGQNPDIDSTALIISTTSWILARSLSKEQGSSSPSSFESSIIPSSRISSSWSSTTVSERPSDYIYALLSKTGITDPSKITDFVLPRLLKAINYLKGRDIDNDGLLEQSHNEDWMDTAVRAGKIVYSQACWLLALNDLSSLLSKLRKSREVDKLTHLADETIHGIEQKLWSEQDGCYLDIQESHHSDPYRILTQDVLFYLIAISQNTFNDSLGIHRHGHRRMSSKSQEQGLKKQQEEQEPKSIHE